MAFDQTTRNRLARFVSNTRSLLAEEFTRQLQNDHGLDPDSGDVTDMTRLEHLDDARRETARLLRDTMEHYLASADTSTPAKAKKARQDVLDRIVREQAFTILNRLCALRMAEARGLLIESIAKGYQSKGFQLYQRLAGTALGETGACYRQFIFSVFDEFAVDLPVLFDRFSPQGRLFPREAALLSVLQEVNHPDIDPLWAEDETIGWIYQYFNSVEERRQMRAASQAPRNSRELAVRNQFFTPRYVVEFLTDNTLGRIWYEMTKGESSLKDSCRYLVRRPNEIFLAEGEAVPEQDDTGEELLQEELLKQPVFILHRPLKDPRDIKMLDPACGSMHFGLYAFDLFERIYEEAWEVEAQRGADTFVRTEGLKPLHGTYSDKEEFLRDIPRLIIERNIHGIDIDPRAVQIAGLSLWLRAQRSWRMQNVKALERPQIQRSNIVCAEPMPGEAEMLEEFTEQLQPKVLGQLVKIIFEKMKLAGEAGSLLKIEEEIRDAIIASHEAYRQHLLDQQKDSQYLPGMAPKPETSLFDFAGLPEEDDFWNSVELRVIDALRDYSEQAEYGSYQRRLFANDAAQGFAFIDLIRKHYDVVLMNPPFGAPSLKIIDLMRDSYTQIKTDLYGAFVIRAIKLANKKGVIGAITSRTGFYVSSFQRWREEILLPHVHLGVMADLGGGVLDSAMVETAAYTLEKPLSSVRNASVCIRLAVVGDKSTTNAEAISDIFTGKFNPNVYLKSETAFSSLPKSPFCYWIPSTVHSIIKHSTPFEPDHGAVYVGVQTDNDERFVRIWVENPPASLGVTQNDAQSGRGWITFLKGDSTSPFYLDHYLTLNWNNNGREIRAATENAPGGRINNENIYYLAGFSWALRTDFFSPHVVPSGCIPSVSRYEAISKEGSLENSFLHLALFSAPIYDFIAKLQMEKWKQPKFIPGVIRNLPVPNLNSAIKETLSCLGAEAVQITRSIYQTLETSREFCFHVPERGKFYKIDKFVKDAQGKLEDQCSKLTDISQKIAQSVDEAFGLLKNGSTVDWFSLLDTNIDDGILPSRPVDNLRLRFSLDLKRFTVSMISWLLGLIFGRWDIRYFTGERLPSNLPDPFSPLPVCPPAMLQNAKGFPIKSKDIPSDYPLHISWLGIIVDDEDHPENIVSRIRESIEVIWKTYAEDIEQKTCECLGVSKLHNYLRHPAYFFDDHLKCYSKSRRQAPLYWPLSTPSGSYTLWLYYHRLTDQTLYTCVNDFVDPKLKQVANDTASLCTKSNRSSAEEKELERLSDLELELKDFRDELLRIARFWKPNLNDGVQITAAPLWNLFQHRQWKARLKETWEKLEAGEYDWAHLVLSIWPDRVVRASHKDRSYAIAHDLEDQLWHEVEVKHVGRGGRVTTTTEWRPRDLSSADLQRIIDDVKAG